MRASQESERTLDVIRQPHHSTPQHTTAAAAVCRVCIESRHRAFMLMMATPHAIIDRPIDYILRLVLVSPPLSTAFVMASSRDFLSRRSHMT